MISGRYVRYQFVMASNNNTVSNNLRIEINKYGTNKYWNVSQLWIDEMFNLYQTGTFIHFVAFRDIIFYPRLVFFIQKKKSKHGRLYIY